MKTRIITLLLGLMAAISLLTVTVWADDPKPTDDDIRALIGTITLQCTHDTKHTSQPGPYDYTGVKSPFTLGALTYNTENTTCSYDLTIPAERFVAFWDGRNTDDRDFHHWQIDNATAEFTLIYTFDTETTEKWSLADKNGNALDHPGITFQVSCEKPALPTAEDLKNQDLRVSVLDKSTYVDRFYDVTSDLCDLSALSSENIYWGDMKDTWLCSVPLNCDLLLKQYQQDVSGNFMLQSGDSIYLKYDMSAKKWVSYGYSFINVIPAPSMELLKELGVTSVNVSCQGGSHDSKTFALTSFDQLSGSWVHNETAPDEYRLFLTSAAADSYVAQYSAAVDKTHTLDSSGYVALIWYQPGGSSSLSLDDGIAVYANTDPVEEDSYRERWMLVGNKAAFNITAVCVNETPRDTSHTRRYPAVTAPVQAAKPTVSSAKTFDGGVALYVGLSLLSVTGSAALLHKRKNV